MADLRIDPEKLAGLLRRYRPEATLRAGRDGTQELVMSCPFHNDSRPSFSFNIDKGVAHCFSCPTKRSYTLLETVAQFEAKNEQYAEALLQKEGVYVKITKAELAKQDKEARKAGACSVKMDSIEKWHATLLADGKQLANLAQVTGWTLDTIKRFQIGLDGARYSIPIINAGIIVNVKFYSPGSVTKYTGVLGSNEVTLWPLDNLNGPDPVWLMEGEKDCILANQCGLNAVTFTGGTKQLALEYVTRFRNRTINIVYDIDPAGRAGALHAAEVISKVTNKVKIIDIPTAGLPANGDFTDFIRLSKTGLAEIHQAVQTTFNYMPEESKTKVKISDEVINTYLEDIVDQKLFFKRVRMRVRVISVGSQSMFLAPQETVVSCNKDLGDQCNSCSLGFSEDHSATLHMRPEYPEILQLIDAKDTEQKLVIRKLLDIYPKCPRVKYEYKVFQAFYPIMLIPALEKDKLQHSYIMQKAWALDVPAKSNEDYLAEGVIFTHPETQEFILLCYKLDKDVSSVDQFELSPDMIQKLRVFNGDSCINPRSADANI